MEKPVRSSFQYLSISYECALAIGNSLNLSEMLHEVIHTMVHKTNAHRGIIWVKNGEQELQPVASAGINIKDVPAQDEIRDLRDVLNQILKSRQFVLRNKDDKDFLQYCPVLTEKEESVLIVPVANVAILYLIYSGAEIADEPLSNLLAGLSKKLSVAIEACMAHKNIINEVQVRVEAEEELRKKTEQLISSEKELQRLYGESEQAGKSLLSILEDVTQKEEALKETTKLLQSVMDNATNEAIITTDRMGIILIWNEGAKRLLGYESEEMVGKESIRIFHTKEYLKSGIMDVNIKKMIATGKSLIEELDYVTKNGKAIPFQEIVSPRFDEDGKFIGTVSMARDITERKQAEKEIMFLSSVVEQSADGTAISDLKGNLLFANDSWVSMHGYKKPKELIGKHLSIFHNKDQFKNDVEPFNRKVMEKGYNTGEVGHIRKDGTIFPTQMTTTILKDENGNPIAMSGVATDITEKMKLGEQLRQARKMESIGRLTGGVAHDFNNMLGVILGHTEMAMEQMDPAQQLFDDLQEIRTAAQRSANLTRQLLAFARKQTVAPKVLNINETVEGMLKMLQRLIGENIDLAWLPGSGVWPIKVDPSQIDQIMANLCVNARDAIESVGKVTIETKNATFDEAHCSGNPGFITGEYVLLTVSDNGCGMDKKTQDMLFEPFFTTKEMGKGTGLGMATIYGIVKQNNGFIYVYSEPGQGTTFNIYLPRHAVKATQMQKEGPAEPVKRGHEIILLVEDESAILKMTTMMLEFQGYTVLSASTPGEAIRLTEAHSGKIDLLLTDVVMPEMNGRDLARNLLSIYPNLKRLFMSGYTANVIAHNGVLDEGVQFIQKPFTMQDLATKVRDALD